jgi:hypothetical protein
MNFEENEKSLFPCLPWRLGGGNFFTLPNGVTLPENGGNYVS